MTRVQGASFDDDVYYRGSRRKLQGTVYTGKLYDADGEWVNRSDDFCLANGDYVYTIGDKCDEDLYKKGTEYSSGLYTSYHASSASYAEFKLAELTTRDVTALTV